MSSVITPDLANEQEGLMFVGGSINRGTGKYINGATVKFKRADIPVKKARIMADGLQFEKTVDGWQLSAHSKAIVDEAISKMATAEELANLVNEHAARLLARVPRF